MPFPAKYLDETKYCSLTVAAERSGYGYSYLSKLVIQGKVEKAPVRTALLVSIDSLNDYIKNKGRKR